MDDDIALRNQNTRDAFLSVAFFSGDPHDALLDVQTASAKMLETFQETLRGEIERAVQRCRDKTEKVIDVIGQLLKHLNFPRNGSAVG